MSTSDFQIRRATESDSRQFWEWRNDPVDRGNSFSTEAIPWEVHRDWFANKFVDPNCHMFVMELRGESVGQLRVEVDRGSCGEIHISVDKRFRARGLAKEALGLVLREMVSCVGVTKLVARVKPDNVRSVVAFIKSGFQFVECVQYKGTRCYEMTKSCI